MKNFSIWHWGIVAIILSIISLLITGLVKAIAVKGIESGDAAAWMQAISAVGAIAAAFLVVDRQHVAAKGLEEDKRRKDQIGRLEAVLAVLSHIESLCQLLRAARDTEPVELMSKSSVDYLMDAKQSISALPVFEIPEPELVVSIVGLPRALHELADTLVHAREVVQKLTTEEAMQFCDINERLHRTDELIALAIRQCTTAICKRQD